MTTSSHKAGSCPSPLNMSNPIRAPRESVALAITGAPSAYLSAEQEQEVKSLRAWRAVEKVRELLAPLDMAPVSTFTISKEHTVDAQILATAGSVLATAESGAMNFRVRSGEAYRMATRMWACLPEEGTFGKGSVRTKMLDTFFVNGGTQNTLGRLAKFYPKVGDRVLRPVTMHEALRALRGSGIDVTRLAPSLLRAAPLIAEEVGGLAVKANPTADNGFPVLGKWETPGAAAKVQGLAKTFRAELRNCSRRPGGVREWKETKEATDPQMVAIRGKAKSDYYSGAKLVAGMMRFYNVYPKQIMLNMQVATQPLEALGKSILEDEHSNTFQGGTLAYGGAEKLVEELDRRLKAKGRAFVHTGDDSWVIIRVNERVVMFALDASSFDLTQHCDATRNVHEAIRSQLERIDSTAADLWFEYARSRVVVVCGAVVRRFRHAGPSGAPLQSKVNGMLMDVLIERALEARVEWENESRVNEHLVRTGKDLGFEIRVEQHTVHRAETLREVLEREPFLFIGSYFHVRNGQVLVMSDWARQMSQLPYPSLKWMKTKGEMQVKEAMRLGSLVSSWGMSIPSADESFEAGRKFAITLLEATLKQHGDQTDEKLRWAIADNPYGPDEYGSTVVPSMTGLLNSLRLGPKRLWAPEKEMAGISELKSAAFVLGASWADEVEEEEARLGAAPAQRPVKATRVKRKVAPTHPVTERNDGRPGPTAVWGPDKAPRRLPYRADAGAFPGETRGRSRPTHGTWAVEAMNMMREEEESASQPSTADGYDSDQSVYGRQEAYRTNRRLFLDEMR